MASERHQLELADLLQTARTDWTLADLLTVLRRRRRYVFVAMAALLLLAMCYCIVVTPRFEALGEIEVQRESPAAFGLETSVTGDAAPVMGDSLDFSLTLETEARILRSNTLALGVIKDLGLETTHEYFPQDRHGFQIPGWLFFWRKPLEPLAVDLDHAPNRQYVALKIFSSHLKITPETGTRLIEIKYSDPDPRLAAAVVNRLMQGLTDYAYQTRFQSTAQASTLLAGQLGELRRQTQQLQEKANRLQRDTGIYGDDDAHNIVLARLDALNERITAAESNRLLADAVDRIAQSGDPELMSTLTVGGSYTEPALSSSLTLLQGLREKRAAVRAEMAEDDARYGPAHPRMAELQSEAEGIEQSIHQESLRLIQRTHADLQVAQAAEQSARDAFAAQKTTADHLVGKAAAYQMARQEADGSRGVYQELLAKLKEAGVLEGLHSTNLTVVNPGRVPPTDRPTSPNLPLYYGAALIGGLLLGCTGAVFAEVSDHTVRSLDGLEHLIGSHLLAVLPELERSKRMWKLASATGQSRGSTSEALFLPSDREVDTDDQRFIESLRSLRTSLLLLRTGRRSQVILVTSSVAGEGKSKIAVNLAGLFAQLGARVLLVDADLRRPSVQTELHLNCSAGLGAALLGNRDPEIQIFDRLQNLSVLCDRDPMPMPSELLASRRMSELLLGWRNKYDFVVLDSAPVLPVTDALVLSQLSDVTLLVARHGFTPKQAVHRSFATLQEQIPETCQMRVVLNGVHAGSYDYRDYYGYGRPAAKRHHAARA